MEKHFGVRQIWAGPLRASVPSFGNRTLSLLWFPHPAQPWASQELAPAPEGIYKGHHDDSIPRLWLVYLWACDTIWSMSWGVSRKDFILFWFGFSLKIDTEREVIFLLLLGAIRHAWNSAATCENEKSQSKVKVDAQWRKEGTDRKLGSSTVSLSQCIKYLWGLITWGLFDNELPFCLIPFGLDFLVHRAKSILPDARPCKGLTLQSTCCHAWHIVAFFAVQGDNMRNWNSKSSWL